MKGVSETQTSDLEEKEKIDQRFGRLELGTLLNDLVIHLDVY